MTTPESGSGSRASGGGEGDATSGFGGVWFPDFEDGRGEAPGARGDRAGSEWGRFALGACAEAFAGSGGKLGSAPRGVHVAPRIPPGAAFSALWHTLRLREDEWPLAVLSGPPGKALVLTTRRLHQVPTRSAGGWTGEGRISRAVDYEELEGSRETSRGLELSSGRLIRLDHLSKRARGGLRDFLERVRRGGSGDELDRGSGSGAVSAEGMRWARERWLGVERMTRAWRGYQEELSDFGAREIITASRARSTPLLALGCLAVFLGMTMVSGASALAPDFESLLAWGANHGPKVALGGEWWRLVASMFLHIGVIHLGLNLLGLVPLGILLERMMGTPAFLATYFLSGLGGSLAGLWAHPTGLSAGASGALFGLIGALGAILALQRRVLPTLLLRLMSRIVLILAPINLAIGFALPMVDNAGHVGGLATGFLAGLALQRPLVRGGDARAGWRGRLTRVAGAAALTGAMGVWGIYTVERAAENRLVNLDHYAVSVGPAERRFNGAVTRFNRELTAGSRGEGGMDFEGLREELDSVAAAARGIALRDPEIEEARGLFVEAVEAFRDTAALARVARRPGDGAIVPYLGADYRARMRKYEELIGEYNRRTRSWMEEIDVPLGRAGD